MDDAAIVNEIDRLMAEEHELEKAHQGEELSPTHRQRLSDLEVQLDQCWDLLRQRRARRNAGLDPDSAEARPATTVEHYLQ
jgi:hypothetical protein